eukprot:scaffold286_cov247-Pinguiococcus_pyrenoidosus.AAC.1
MRAMYCGEAWLSTASMPRKSFLGMPSSWTFLKPCGGRWLSGKPRSGYVPDSTESLDDSKDGRSWTVSTTCWCSASVDCVSRTCVCGEEVGGRERENENKEETEVRYLLRDIPLFLQKIVPLLYHLRVVLGRLSREALHALQQIRSAAVEAGMEVEALRGSSADPPEAVEVELALKGRELAVMKVARQGLHLKALLVHDDEASAVLRPADDVVIFVVDDVHQLGGKVQRTEFARSAPLRQVLQAPQVRSRARAAQDALRALQACARVCRVTGSPASFRDEEAARRGRDSNGAALPEMKSCAQNLRKGRPKISTNSAEDCAVPRAVQRLRGSAACFAASLGAKSGAKDVGAKTPKRFFKARSERS